MKKTEYYIFIAILVLGSCIQSNKNVLISKVKRNCTFMLSYFDEEGLLGKVFLEVKAFDDY